MSLDLPKPFTIVHPLPRENISEMIKLTRQLLEEIVKKSWKIHFSWDEWAKEFYQAWKSTPMHEISGIFHKGEIIGYFWIHHPEKDEIDNFRAWLTSIIIKPEYQGIGVGSAVIKYLEEKLSEQYNEIRLGVQKNNVRALNFYKKKCRFTKVSFVPETETIVLRKRIGKSLAKNFEFI